MLRNEEGHWVPNYSKRYQAILEDTRTEEEQEERRTLMRAGWDRKRKTYVLWWNAQLKKEGLIQTKEKYLEQLDYNYEEESFQVYRDRADPVKQELIHKVCSVEAVQLLLKSDNRDVDIDYFGTLEDAPNDCIWKFLAGLDHFDKIQQIFAPLGEEAKGFVETLEEFCLGIFAFKTAEKWYLIYLMDNYDEIDSPKIKFDYTLDFHIGAEPTLTPKLTRVKNWIIPNDLKLFYTIHNGFGALNGGSQIFWANNIAPDDSISDMQFMVDIVKEQNDEPEDYKYENLLDLYSDGSGNGYFFYRDSLDDANPDVRYWDHETREIGHRQSFMEFLNVDFFRDWYNY
ncbi:MAG: SMI1/KNR4 family protein [Aureispira sp.]|nr:SMI1/KNR4 family protein [Aureispira sp.]